MTSSDKDTCWGLTVVASLINGLFSLLTSNTGFMYVGMMEQFNVNREAASWPVSVLYIAIHLSGIGVGLLHKRFSMRTIGVLLSVFLWAGVFCSVFATSVTLMTFTYGVLHGLGAGGLSVVSLYIVMAYFDKYKGTASGVAHLGDCTFALFYPKLLVFLKEQYGFRGALFIHVAVAMNVTPLSFLLKEPPQKAAKNVEAKPPTTPVATISPTYATFPVKQSPEAVKRNDSEFGRRIRLTLGKPGFYMVLICYMFLHFAQPLFLTTMIDFAIDRGATESEASSIWTFLSPVEIVARVSVPTLCDKINVRSGFLVLSCFFMAGAGLLVLPQTETYAFLASVSILIVMLQGLILTMKPVVIADYIGLENLSFTFGLIGVGAIPLLLGTPYFIGYYRDHMGAYDNMFRVLGGVHILLSLVLLPVVCQEIRHKKSYAITH